MPRCKISANITSFPLSFTFVEKYMPDANATFVKVYLYGLRQCYSENGIIQNKDIAKTLNIIETDVINAWKYWSDIGIITLIPIEPEPDDDSSENKSGFDFDIEFLNIDAIPSKAPHKADKSNTAIIETRPSYSQDELAEYAKTSPQIGHLFKYVGRKMGKILSVNDLSVLYSFYDWLGLPIEVIILLIEYAVSINKTNWRYIEKIALSWNEMGIDSAIKAEKLLKEEESKNSKIYMIKKTFGILGRELTNKEKEFAAQWIDWNVSEEMMKKAYDQSVTAINKASFPYVHKILDSWREQGVTNTVQADESIKKFRENNPQAQNKLTVQNSSQSNYKGQKKNRFINFEQPDYDFEELEKWAIQRTYDWSEKDGV